jgi:hypothetical protein
MGNVARIIAMAGAVGETGLALVDIINDPLMAPLVIMDLLSKGNLRTPNAYRDSRCSE